jgi:hypothetical protein
MPSGQRIKDVYAKIRKEWKKRRDQYARSRPEEAMAITGRHVLLARVREGKFLARHHYVMEGNSLEKELPEVLRKAEKDGYTARHITLLLNGAGSPVRTRRFPRMTEDELEETVYWEEDRLFGTAPHSADYRILSSSPEGYDILAAGVREEIMARLTGLFEEAGKTLDRVVPAVETAVPEDDKSWAFLLGGRQQGLLALGRGPGAIEVRRVRKKEDREAAEAWVRRVEKRMGSPERLCFLPAWEGTDRAGWEETFPFLPWEKKQNDFPEEQPDCVSLFSALTGLSDCHMNLAMREIRRESPFRRKSPAERRLRGALIISLCLLCGTVLYTGSEMTRYIRARGEWEDMAPVRASWAKWHEAQESQKEMARGLHAIQQKGGIWEGRLVYLAEAAGGLVELKRLDASDGDVRIKGMAGTEEQAREFGSRLSSLWGGRVRMHSIRRNQNGTGITFELSQRGEEEGIAGTGEEKTVY